MASGTSSRRPFTPSGDLDLASVRRLTDFVIGTGVDGLTILGVMGEAPKLSDAERSAVIEATVGGGRRTTARVRRDQPSRRRTGPSRSPAKRQRSAPTA